MEKVSRAISKTYHPVKLYLEDLQRIVDIFESSRTGKVEIICGDYRYLDLNELKAAKARDLVGQELQLRLTSASEKDKDWWLVNVTFGGLRGSSCATP